MVAAAEDPLHDECSPERVENAKLLRDATAPLAVIGAAATGRSVLLVATSEILLVSAYKVKRVVTCLDLTFRIKCTCFS